MVIKLFKFTVNSLLIVVAICVADLFIENKLDILWNSGIIRDTIPIAGTGSMFPTYPKGSSKDPKVLGKEIVAEEQMYRYPRVITMFGRTLFSYKPQFLDIVSFSNNGTIAMSTELYGDDEAGYIKRIIGLPNDQIELRDGVVYRNSQPLKEGYIALPHSTFGGTGLNECTKIIVPQNKLFVMGDNRKGSLDSRFELGYIDIKDIDHYIPYSMQQLKLRDTSNDLKDSSKIQIDLKQLLTKINELRINNNVKAITYEPKLDASAQKRGEVIIKYNDFSFDGEKSKYTMKQAMNDVGYDNIVWGEIPVTGYYTAEEITENFAEFPESLSFLLNPDFENLGVAVVHGDINGCPTQVIVMHFAGYKPAHYENNVISSWQAALKNLKDIRPGWESLKDYSDFYAAHKGEIDRIIEIIDIRSVYITSIVSKMSKSEWLSQSEQTAMNNDSKLVDEYSKLANSINDSISDN